MMLLDKLRNSVLTAAAVLALASCEPDLEPPTPKAGEADFSTYVAVGNSLTAGFSDGALYRELQELSFPSMIAEQMTTVGGGAFTQPLVPEGNGLGSGGNGKFILIETSAGLTPVPQPGDPSVLASVAADGPFNNVGVPGARAVDLVIPGYGSDLGNPFFARFTSDPMNTMIDEALRVNPTFFTLWAGNNDVLGYATAGGESGAVTPSEGSPGIGFDASLDAAVAQMKAANPNIQGAIANIPDILKTPYFTTIMWNDLVLTGDQAAELNTGLQAGVAAQARPSVEAQVIPLVREQVRAGVVEVVRVQVTAQVAEGLRQQLIAQGVAAGLSEEDAAAQADAFIASEDGQAAIAAEVAVQMESDEVQALIEANTDAQMETPEVQALINQNVEEQLALLLGSLPSFSEGANGFLIADDTNPLGFRQAREGEYILLPALAVLSDPSFIPATPLDAALVLDTEETANIRTAISAYNVKIADVASQNNLALVDISTFFDDVADGFTYDAVDYSTTFVTGGAFSLDGLHLTDRGAALAANEFIRAINAHYNASVPTVNVNQYKGIRFP